MTDGLPFGKDKIARSHIKKAKKRKPKITNVKSGTWNMFSQMTRIRDGIKTTGNPNRAVCCTCGTIHEYNDLHAGHFLPGRLNNNLFDERGVHAQCDTCNTKYRGEPVKYYEYMMQEYGVGIIEELNRQNHGTRTYTRDELLEMRKEYKERIKQMLRESDTSFHFNLLFSWDGK